MALKDKIKAPRPKARKGPVWKGPEVDGVTQSLLSRFLVCRERFHAYVVEGLRTAEQFSAPVEVGNMWHACEEALAADGDWKPALTKHCEGLVRKYPYQQEQVRHWHAMVKALFPVYVDHWARHPDIVNRTPLMQEQVFDVPYKLPSGRTVRLRGKWDSVDLVKPDSRPKAKGADAEAGIWLMESKTKSSIDEVKLARQLKFDLQTMLYLVALEEGESLKSLGDRGRINIRGVRYNVIRRSAHKSPESMLDKVEADRKANRINEWFTRFNVEVSAADVERFRRECLDPILEQLCWWWEEINWKGGARDLYDPPPSHWRHPFGVYNVLDEGGSSDLDNYLDTGSEVGLTRVTEMFPELKEIS